MPPKGKIMSEEIKMILTQKGIDHRFYFLINEQTNVLILRHKQTGEYKTVSK